MIYVRVFCLCFPLGHSSILAWRIPLDSTEQLSLSFRVNWFDLLAVEGSPKTLLSYQLSNMHTALLTSPHAALYIPTIYNQKFVLWTPCTILPTLYSLPWQTLVSSLYDCVVFLFRFHI